MGYEALSDLAKLVEHTAKKMVKPPYIPLKYLYLSLLLPLYIVSLFIPLENTLYYVTVLLSGLTGSTTLTIYLIISIYLFDKHLELAKYYYLGLRDLLRSIKDERYLEDLNNNVNKYLLIDKMGVEYSPVLLVPAYTSLILINERVYAILFMALYVIITSIIVYEVIERYNRHIRYEDELDKRISELLRYRYRAYTTAFNDRKLLAVILMIFTLSIYIIVLLNKWFIDLEKHLDIHRSNYTLLKNTMIRLIGY
jgi:hypothetical protein